VEISWRNAGILALGPSLAVTHGILSHKKINAAQEVKTVRPLLDGNAQEAIPSMVAGARNQRNPNLLTVTD
jgi:hypothetical protein